MSEVGSTHSVILENRKKIMLSGVKDVISFSDDLVAAITELGEITIKGENIKMNNFNTEKGDLSATGNIIAVVYSAKSSNDGFLKKLFR